MLRNVIRQSLKSRCMASSSNSSLVTALNKEHKFELENVEGSTSWIQEFKDAHHWSIKDTEGIKEVTLTKQFNNEKISAIFSTDSLQDQEQNMDAPEGEENDSDTPVQVSIIIEKLSVEGAIEIQTTAQEDAFFIDNVAFISSAKLALEDTAEADWVRRGKFGGPVFGDMDEGLIETFHSFIEERGFDKEMAEFVASYVVYKEQQEYVKWLAKVSKFVSK